MKAIAITPGKPGIRIVEREEPRLRAPDEVKVQVLQVGICGTDREEIAGGRCAAPEGQDELVIGHEMLGRVVETGTAVTRVAPGDHAVFMVRRPCGYCPPCNAGRSDLCASGDFRERGIWKLDGYQAEFVLDREAYAVKVPAQLAAVAVLTEPLSVAEKAIDEALRLQNARLPEDPFSPQWLEGRHCLVAGLGPIGLLAAVVLRLRGAAVYGLDVVDETSSRPRWLTRIGGRYIDGRQVTPEQMPDKIGAMDLIFEATGVPALEFDLLDALAYDGVYVLTGIPAGNRPLDIPGAELIRKLVLNNQLMVGSVNASLDHYRMAVTDLGRARERWGDHLEGLITHRVPCADLGDGLQHHGDDEIKAVVQWA